MVQLNVLVFCLFSCVTVFGQEKLKVGFNEQLTEVTNEACTTVQGNIPAWLQGDFVRQACGSWGDLANKAEPLTYIEHLFDCISMVAAFTITEGNVTYSTKYYDTTHYNIWSEYGKDMRKSKVAWTTAYTNFDTARAANWSEAFPDKYPDEPSVNFWLLEDELLAGTESTNFALLDTETFDTVGIYPFKDKNIGQPEGTILINNPAHEQVDSDGVFYSAVTAITFRSQTKGTAKYIIYKIIDGERIPLVDYPVGYWDLSKCSRYPEPYPDLSTRPGYAHSFAVTENYIIFPHSSYLLDYCHVMVYSREHPQPFFRNGYKWYSEQQSKVLVFEKKTGKFLAKIETEPFFISHQFNAFERDGSILNDVFSYPNADVYEQLFADTILSATGSRWKARIERFDIKIDGWSLDRRVIAEIDDGEFAAKNEKINGEEYQYGYFVSGLWSEVYPRRIVKMDMESGEMIHWEASGDHFPQEPQFIPRPGGTAEDDGLLVVGGFNSRTKKGFMVLLDAKNLTLISEVEAPLLTPIGIHNRFYFSGAFGASSHPVMSAAVLVLIQLGRFILSGL